MNPKKLTLELGGKKIPANRFRKGINAFLDLIDEVVRDYTKLKKAVRWIVSVNPGSLRIDLSPEPLNAPVNLVEKIPAIVESGLESLETKTERPDYFSDYALEKAHLLGTIVDVTDAEIEAVMIRHGRKVAHITTQSLANIDFLLATPVRSFGTIEGKLQMISERGGLHFAVYDALTDHPVRCNFEPEMLQEITGAFLKRVRIYGQIYYKKDGEPKRIRIEEFYVISDEGLPTFEDVYGILGRSK